MLASIRSELQAGLSSMTYIPHRLIVAGIAARKVSQRQPCSVPPSDLIIRVRKTVCGNHIEGYASKGPEDPNSTQHNTSECTWTRFREEVERHSETSDSNSNAEAHGDELRQVRGERRCRAKNWRRSATPVRNAGKRPYLSANVPNMALSYRFGHRRPRPRWYLPRTPLAANLSSSPRKHMTTGLPRWRPPLRRDRRR